MKLSELQDTIDMFWSVCQGVLGYVLTFSFMFFTEGDGEGAELSVCFHSTSWYLMV